MRDWKLRWLLAQIQDDEDVAKGAIRRLDRPGAGQWPRDDDDDDYCSIDVDGEMEIYDEGGHTPGQAKHICRHDPARVLATVAALRTIVDMHSGPHECVTEEDNCVWVVGTCDTQRAVASIYRDNPGYTKRWGRA